VDTQTFRVSCVCGTAGLAKSIGLEKVGQREKDLRLVKEILYIFLWFIQTKYYFFLSISNYENSLQKLWIGKSDRFAYLCEKFPALSTEKLRAGIFYGSQVWRLNAGQLFSTYLDNPRKNAWWSLTAVVENFLGYFKATNYRDLSKQLINSYEKLGCNMSVKVRFFHSHVNYIPENVEAMIEEQGESFHQDIKTIEKILAMLEYQHVGRLLLVLRKRLLAIVTLKKHRRQLLD